MSLIVRMVSGVQWLAAEPTRVSTASRLKIRRAYLAAAYCMFAIVVARAFLDPRPTSSTDLFGTTLAVLVTMTCVADSAVRGSPLVLGERFPFLIAWPIVVPLYAIATRGWWGLILLSLHLGLLIAVLIVCAVVSFCIRL